MGAQTLCADDRAGVSAPFSGGGVLMDGVPAGFGGEGILGDLDVYARPVDSGVGGLAVAVAAPYPEPGEFPDFEQVLIDLLTPITYTCQTLPLSAELLAAALPLLWVRRDGGGLDFDQITDTAHVRVIAMSDQRAQSWHLARQAREAIVNCPGADINGALIDWAQEITGQLEMGDLDPLRRDVEIAFRMEARRQSR
jgi:hypothetical protein